MEPAPVCIDIMGLCLFAIHLLKFELGYVNFLELLKLFPLFCVTCIFFTVNS